MNSLFGNLQSTQQPQGSGGGLFSNTSTNNAGGNSLFSVVNNNNTQSLFGQKPNTNTNTATNVNNTLTNDGKSNSLFGNNLFGNIGSNANNSNTNSNTNSNPLFSNNTNAPPANFGKFQNNSNTNTNNDKPKEHTSSLFPSFNAPNALTKPAIKKAKKETVNPSIIKRENMIIYLLINNFEEAYEKIVTNITADDFKLEINKIIFEKIMESTVENSEKILQLISNIEDEDIQSHVSQILVTDYEITSVQKCIEDVIKIYNKDKLQKRKLEIIRLLEDNTLGEDERKNLEQELNDIMMNWQKKS